jgi:hypothetical protein
MKNKSITQNILSYILVAQWSPRYENFFRRGQIVAGITLALFHATVGITSAISLMATSIAAFFLMRETYYANKVWKHVTGHISRKVSINNVVRCLKR